MIEVFLEYLGTCKIDLLLSYEKPVIDLFYLLNLNIIKCLLPKNYATPSIQTCIKQ